MTVPKMHPFDFGEIVHVDGSGIRMCVIGFNYRPDYIGVDLSYVVKGEIREMPVPLWRVSRIEDVA